MIRPVNGKDSGFTLLDFVLAISVFMTGVLGFASSILSSQSMRRTTHEQGSADEELQRVLEQFRQACAQDFDAAIAAYRNGQFTASALPGLGTSKFATIATDVMLDETKLQPVMDLDGKNGSNNKLVLAQDLNIAVLTATVSWPDGGGATLTRSSTAYVARGEVGASKVNPGTNNKGNGSPATPPGKGGVPPGQGGSPPGQTAPPTLTGGPGNTGGTLGGSSSVNVISSQVTGKRKNAVSASVIVDAPADLPVVGVTVGTSKKAFVSQIKVGGGRVYRGRSNLPATGSMIPVSPFTLTGQGSSIFDKFKFSGTSGGRSSIDMTGTSFTINLHLEDGSSVAFSFDV
ncbi:MAG: type II secretion system protein J [Planctomycetota bacterium]